MPGATVTFKLLNPAGTTPVNTATSITDGEGAAYYSYDLNSKNYWGNWKIDANVTVGGNNTAGSSSFVLYWWGCGQCHGSESPGKWGSIYTPKSYYSKGYGFHKSQNKAKHTETMSKSNCITCHQMYDGIPRDRGYNDNTPAIYIENEYSPDRHKGKSYVPDVMQDQTYLQIHRERTRKSQDVMIRQAAIQIRIQMFAGKIPLQDMLSEEITGRYIRTYRYQQIHIR